MIGYNRRIVAERYEAHAARTTRKDNQRCVKISPMVASEDSQKVVISGLEAFYHELKSYLVGASYCGLPSRLGGDCVWRQALIAVEKVAKERSDWLAWYGTRVSGCRAELFCEWLWAGLLSSLLRTKACRKEL